MAAQICHAAGESIKSPIPSQTIAVVLEVPGELELRALHESLSAIPHVLIVESDAPYEGQACAIGLVPTADRDTVRKILSSLPLLRERSSKELAAAESVNDVRSSSESVAGPSPLAPVAQLTERPE